MNKYFNSFFSQFFIRKASFGATIDRKKTQLTKRIANNKRTAILSRIVIFSFVLFVFTQVFAFGLSCYSKLTKADRKM